MDNTLIGYPLGSPTVVISPMQVDVLQLSYEQDDDDDDDWCFTATFVHKVG